jgi:AcrR family transcriptional regulator
MTGKPPKAGKTRKRQRSQDQRRRETQEKILRAAIDLLVEKGYAGFSTIAVAARAGVSRGARENYFRTKYDLIGAAWRAALERAGQTSQGLASDVKESSDPAGQFLESARAFFLSRDYVAMLELSIAARSDARLARIFRSLFKDYRKRHDDIWIHALQQVGYKRSDIEKFVDLANSLLRGMALTAAWKLPSSRGSSPLEELHRLAPLLLTPGHARQPTLKQTRAARQSRATR